MSELNWSQDVFSKGELSPYMYARLTTDAYQKGLYTAQNVLTYPQGAAGKRFGTEYLNTITGPTQYQDIFFECFPYLNQCLYWIVIYPLTIKVYLEGILVATVTSNVPYTTSDMPTLDATVLENRFRVTSIFYKPKDLIRGEGTPQTISSVSGNVMTISPGITAGLIIPVTFTIGAGVLPTTNPQILLLRTYFIFTNSATTATIYPTAEDAKAGTNQISIVTTGTTVTIHQYNAWTFPDAVFRNLPVYDFTPAGTYDSITFTPTAVSGYSKTLIASSAIFSAAYVGGAFEGNGGIARITAFTDTTHVTIDIVQDFGSLEAIPGNVGFLGEPAWSTVRGWPSRCSSFQNRAIFANSLTLANGLWLSVVNDYDDFDDIQTDDDFAISWYPTSGDVNYIRFIVPYRSLTIHTNTGIYSTPLSFETAVTRNNFSMTLQDSTPATSIQPRGIDNQIIILSGNDVHSMLWDGYNNSYTSSIASISSEQLIRNPHDESEYVDLERAGSRYVFIVNEDGTLAVFQTLISEGVSGFTPMRLKQTYGNAYFRWVASSNEGRAIFVNERQIATSTTTVAISDFSTNYLINLGDNLLPTDTFTAVTFTVTNELPVSDPQIVVNKYYWAVGINATSFSVYLTQEDALSGENNLTFTSQGDTSQLVTWPLTSQFMLEELDFDIKTDCAVLYNGSATSTIGTVPRFNAQDILIQGDGYGFVDSVGASTIDIAAHGQPVQVTTAQAGFPIEVIIEPLQPTPPGSSGFKSSNFVFAQHLRSIGLMFLDTIGGFVNNQPITINTFNQTSFGVPPVAATGVMQFTPMKGWNQNISPPFTITHEEPFDIKLIGIFYKMET